MTHTYDVVILGGGTGGYITAIRAAQLGKTVAVVERDKLGGTCLHRGCIPSKALLRSAEVYSTMKEAEAFGVEASGLSLNFGKVQERKNKTVQQLHSGVQMLMKKHKIDVYYGNGRIVGPSIFSPKAGAVAVEQEDGDVITLVNSHLVIATGSRPRIIPGLEPDGERVFSSDEALELEALPPSIIIVGGGVIGVEWASMLNDFGVEVTIVEAERRLLPLEDEDVSKELARLFAKRGIRILTGVKVQADTLEKHADGVTIAAAAEGAESSEVLTAGALLVSVGRAPNVEGIGLENTDVKLERGFIRVNEWQQTAEPHIYAIGDCTGGPQLAHAAAHMGIVAAEHLSGDAQTAFHGGHVPRCVYTRPEIASVGLTEREAREAGRSVKIGKFPYQALGKAIVHGEPNGFAKVVTDAETDDILGVHLIGERATDMIGEAALAQLLNASVWEMAQLIRPHPTLAEALGEAVLAVDGRSLAM
ncbi:dihydrolipoyl dehydrogenase [Paenibacillus turpanensis]|uniref:dihydrolipoyl dehydrogenase n=1 Tax=Paenibacillus turpanensis TaxID=2689078 RepID=UPI001408B493|nr:dihydrolipoyl dehydrogenase [Paenibacillus turpanensis]